MGYWIENDVENRGRGSSRIEDNKKTRIGDYNASRRNQ